MTIRCQQGQRKRALDHTDWKEEQRQECIAKGRRIGPRARYPAEFWDSLSRIPLTRGALRELDRRTADIHSTQAGSKTVEEGTQRRVLRANPRRLQAFASRGGPNLSWLRGYSSKNPTRGTMSASSRPPKRDRASRTGKSGSTDRTKTTSPYDAAFKQKMEDNGVYDDGHEDSAGDCCEPDNLEIIREALAQPRSSLSPSRWSGAEYKAFKREHRQASSESQIMMNAVPFITGAKDRDFERSGDIPFNNMEKIDPTITTPKPDMYYGARAADVHPRVRQDLGSYIIPSRNMSQPIAPNAFLAGKSKNGLASVGQSQAMYDGYIGARGMLWLQSYGKPELVYDGKAYSIASSYHPGTGTLQMYATHPAPPAQSGGKPRYFTTQLDTYGLTGNFETFRRGIGAYRNSREWTRKQRDEFIANANLVAQSRTAPSEPTRRVQVNGARKRDGQSRETTYMSDSDPSEDELAEDMRRAQRRRHS